eukprot:scaffold732_cov60-Phaeocystis_antarctica.AAC.24
MSVSTTCDAPSAAHTRPEQPGPAPSSMTRFPATRCGWAQRYLESTSAVGHSRRPVPSASDGTSASGFCSISMGWESASLVKRVNVFML